MDEGETGIAQLASNAADPWWSETIVLAAGIQRDATDLVKRVYKKMAKQMADEQYLMLGRCLTDADLTEFELKDEIVARVIQLAHPVVSPT